MTYDLLLQYTKVLVVGISCVIFITIIVYDTLFDNKNMKDILTFSLTGAVVALVVFLLVRLFIRLLQ